jgi:hypothetical protein
MTDMAGEPSDLDLPLDEPHEPNPETDPVCPPKKNCVVVCLHCREQYDSYRIHWVEEPPVEGKRRSFWCCPIDGCDGKGFRFDIHPIDANWEDEEDRGMTGGWFDDDGNRVSPLDGDD